MNGIIRHLISLLLSSIVFYWLISPGNPFNLIGFAIHENFFSSYIEEDKFLLLINFCLGLFLYQGVLGTLNKYFSSKGGP